MRSSTVLQLLSSASGLPPTEQLRNWIRTAVRAPFGAARLTIRIVDEPESQALNRDYRGIDKPTNVLSFSYDPPPGREGIVGDLVICAPVVAREAAEQGKPLEAHWAHMVVHGTLHLLGYDHQNDEEARVMEALEVQILAELGFPDPYAVA